MSAAFETLIEALKALHITHPELAAFCPFADDLGDGDMAALHRPAADLLRQEQGFSGAGPYSTVIAAACAAAPEAQWRETYKGSAINADFSTRFGCYCVVGSGGYKASRRMAGYLVYMPAGLEYPFHQHPAEEMYVVLAGEALFQADTAPSRKLGAGEAVFHRAHQPHAIRTEAKPMLAYAAWRNGLGIKPVWCDPALRV